MSDKTEELDIWDEEDDNEMTREDIIEIGVMVAMTLSFIGIIIGIINWV